MILRARWLTLPVAASLALTSGCSSTCCRKIPTPTYVSGSVMPPPAYRMSPAPIPPQAEVLPAAPLPAAKAPPPSNYAPQPATSEPPPAPLAPVTREPEVLPPAIPPASTQVSPPAKDSAESPARLLQPEFGGNSSTAEPPPAKSQPESSVPPLNPPAKSATEDTVQPVTPPPARTAPDSLPKDVSPPPPLSESKSSPVASLPVGIADFANAVDDRVTAGRKPTIEGLDWLKSNGYKSVLLIRRPGESDDADRKQFSDRGIRFLSLELSPAGLTRNKSDEFNQFVADRSGHPLFVYDADGSLAGSLWYLYFRRIEMLGDEAARVRASRLGLKTNATSGEAAALWQATQRLMK